MAESYFVGIKLIGTSAEQLTLFQREIATRAKNSYGFEGVVSHGKSPLHITLVSPAEGNERMFVEAVRSVARRYAPFQITLSRPGILLASRAIATRCEQGLQTLLKMRTELHRKLDLSTPDGALHASGVPHVSIVRKVTPVQSFSFICAAADEVFLENPGRWPLQAPCYGLTLFKKSDADAPWVDASYHALTSIEQPQ